MPRSTTQGRRTGAPATCGAIGAGKVPCTRPKGHAGPHAHAWRDTCPAADQGIRCLRPRGHAGAHMYRHTWGQPVR